MEFHMMVRKSIGALVLTVVVAASSSAQAIPLQTAFEDNFQFVSAPGGANTYTGKFTTVASLTGYPVQTNAQNLNLTGESVNTAFQIWCVDPMQFTNGSANAAWVTPLNVTGATGFSHTLATQTLVNGNGWTHAQNQSNTAAAADYLAAAKLAWNMQTGGNDINNVTYTVDDYQRAMWEVMGYTPTSAFGDQAHLDQLKGWFTGGSYCTGQANCQSGFDIAQWSVITEGTTLQEFLYQHAAGTPQSTVPEPGTMSLLAMGMAGMGGAIRRRRSRKA
jgi:PEP-CTERM motif